MKKAKETKEVNLFMDKLAANTNLTHDGGSDNRLFAKTIYTNSKKLTEEEYEAMEEEIDQFLIQGEGFEVYAWNDSSGYNYWTIKQEENNYIQITVAILDLKKVNSLEIKKAVNKAFEKFNKYNIGY